MRRTSSGIGSGRLQRTLGRWLEREFEHLVDAEDRVEGHAVPNICWNVLEVCAVALRKDDLGQSGGVSRKNLCFSPPIGSTRP